MACETSQPRQSVADTSRKPALEQVDEVLAGTRCMLYASVADMEAVVAARRKQEAAEHAKAEAAAQALLEVSSIAMCRVC